MPKYLLNFEPVSVCWKNIVLIKKVKVRLWAKVLRVITVDCSLCFAFDEENSRHLSQGNQKKRIISWFSNTTNVNRKTSLERDLNSHLREHRSADLPVELSSIYQGGDLKVRLHTAINQADFVSWCMLLYIRRNKMHSSENSAVLLWLNH